jgi:hypothetical protein
VIRSRKLGVALAGTVLASGAACGGQDSARTAGTRAVPVAPGGAATTPIKPVGLPEPADDRTLCKQARKAVNAQKDAVLHLTAETRGNLSPGDFKVIMFDLSEQLTAAAGTVDSEVAKAMKAMAKQSRKAGAATDPVSAAEKPAFAEAGTELTAACRKAGVKVTF